MSAKIFNKSERRDRARARSRRSSSIRARAATIISEWHPEDWAKARGIAETELNFGPLPHEKKKTDHVKSRAVKKC